MTTSLAQFQATTRQLWQAWQAKTITSDLIFEMVMQNPTLCTELVQRALPELEVGPLHLVNPQQDVHSALLARAVRYDIYAQDEAGRTFVLEMQVKDERDLAERIRYYQGMMDQLLLRSGDSYRQLATFPTYVIFFCQFDYYGRGWARYRFEDREITDPLMTAHNGQHSVIFNATASDYRRAGALGPFLDLMAGNVNNKDKFIAQIQAEIKSIKMNQERWLENMLYELKMQERFDAGEEQGLNTERNRTVQKFIAWSRQRGADQATVVTDLAELYGISKQEAQRYYDQAQLTNSH